MSSPTFTSLGSVIEYLLRMRGVKTPMITAVATPDRNVRTTLRVVTPGENFSCLWLWAGKCVCVYDQWLICEYYPVPMSYGQAFLSVIRRKYPIRKVTLWSGLTEAAVDEECLTRAELS